MHLARTGEMKIHTTFSSINEEERLLHRYRSGRDVDIRSYIRKMRKSSARKNSIGLAVGGKTWLLRHTENQTSKACTADNEMRHLKRT
jgi:hypothetical protein